MAGSREIVSLVDGAQAVGQFPIDITDLECDAYSASLHKWMLAPAGTGFMYIKNTSRELFSSSFNFEENDAAFAPPGTPDFPVRAAIAASIEFMETLGLDLVEQRCRYLSDHLKNRLAAHSKVTLLSGIRNQSAPGSTIFEVDGLDAIESVEIAVNGASSHIDEHQRDGHNAIRISTHVYNTTGEIDRVVDLLIS